MQSCTPQLNIAEVPMQLPKLRWTPLMTLHNARFEATPHAKNMHALISFLHLHKKSWTKANQTDQGVPKKNKAVQALQVLTYKMISRWLCGMT